MDPSNWEDIDHNPTYRDCQIMEKILADMILYIECIQKGDFETAKKHTRLAMFCSAFGLGKTYTGTRVLRRAGIKIKKTLNPSNASALTYDLWGCVRRKEPVIVIDDADRLMRSDPMVGIMKTAWNQDDPRVNCFMTKEIRKNALLKEDDDDRYNPDIPDPAFDFWLAGVWFANKRLDTAKGREAAKCCVDFPALIERGLFPMWIDSHPRNVCFYTIWMIVRGGLFRNLGLTKQQQVETLEFFMDVACRGHPNPNLRLAVTLAKARHNDDYGIMWERIVRLSLKGHEDEPRALTIDDLKGAARPNLEKEIDGEIAKRTISVGDKPIIKKPVAEKKPVVVKKPVVKKKPAAVIQQA